MNAIKLLSHQLEDTTFQITKVLEGVKESDLDFKIGPTTQSIRGLIEHLCEVYTAVEEESRGEHHKWGSYSIEDKSWGNLINTFTTLRSRAIELVSSPESEQQLFSASDFMVGHEYYHVGQLASIRIATDPEWDPFSIYRHG